MEESFNQDGWSLSNCHNQHYRLSLGFRFNHDLMVDNNLSFFHLMVENL
jgi:hypothetical protein